MIKNKFFRTVMSLGLMAGLLATSDFSLTAEAKKTEYVGAKEYKTYEEMISAIESTSGEKTVFIQTNDVHGAIDNYASVKSLKDKLNSMENVDAVLVDCGDFLWAKEGNKPEEQAYSYVNDSKGLAPTILMNAAGYDYATIGNHEFEFAVDGLHKCIDYANFNITSANLYENNSLIYAPNFVYESPADTKNKIKIGLFGLTAPEATARGKNEKYKVEGITVTKNDKDNKPLSDIARNQIKALNAQNVNLIVFLSHLGVKIEDGRSTLDYNRSVDLYYDLMDDNGNNPIDLILDGHSHTELTSGGGTLNSDGRPVDEANGSNKNAPLEPVISAGIRMPSVGITIINNEDKDEKGHINIKDENRFLVPMDSIKSNLEPDKEVNALYEAIKNNISDTNTLQAFLKKQHEAYTNGQPLPTASDLTGETTEDTTEPEDDDKDKTNETTEVTDQDTTVEETTEEPTQDVQEPEAPSDKDPRAGHHEPSSHGHNGHGGRSGSGHNSGHSSRNHHSHHHHH